VALRLLAGLLVLAYAGPLVGKDKDAKAEKAPAKLLVKIRGDAELLIQGDPTRQTGSDRGFESPPLDPGKEYVYTLVAKWEPNNYTKITRTYKVDVKAGETVRVDMTKKNPNFHDDIVIRFVPTPDEVVQLMCKMAGVGKEDIVYDLGCGDGRIVIAAVGEKWGAKKGVGVDLDPERIKESKENAKKVGVEGKVEFRKEDVFKVAKEEIDQASVVMLYMSNDTNEQLRPILQAKLKPGSRIVSHRFLMGDWKPDKTETVEVDGAEIEVHLWNIGPKEEKPDDKKPDEKQEDKQD
jgi:uncharacterized protein (TIGR03000 family)